ncbi:ABC transporter substrate-binding protein [Actinomadura kijaniata]|uniref:ABC transporter substrate-binding protein n=1 Tax=Actinomadura kijaniata TaxID=46161 RepID=UPI00082F1B41|nr:ABC transporter substrate-binding protein [Actinomadura kijaniata]
MPEVAPLRDGDPRRIGGYALTGLLGEGGQGAVYLAEDEPGHPVAVKLLHARFSGDARARQRFAAELAVTRRVAPFCTARVLDADVDGDRPYIVSEYIDGPPLARVLAEHGPRSGAELDRLAIGTMTALTAIHEAGVAHRDLKPGNVLLAADGPRVIDFGIARALDATGTLSSTAVGTPAYMAPEQITGARVGPAADVFAWGTTMVTAATGRPAFGQDSIPAVMHRILHLPPELGALPEPLRSVVAGCLDKDPARRPASQQVLLRLLSLAGSLPPASAPTPARPAVSLDKDGMLDRGVRAAATGAFAAPPAAPQTWPPPPPTAPAPPAFPQPQYPPPPNAQQTVPGKEDPRRRGVGILVGAGSGAAVALVLVGGLILANFDGTGKKPLPPVDRVGGTLSVMVNAPYDPKGHLAPEYASGGTGTMLARQLFTGLAEVTPQGTLRNRLATAITPDDTCTNWKITVRSGTRFANGEPVDAEAFARGWGRGARNPSGTASYLMRDIKGYDEVAGKKTDRLAGVRASGQTLDVALTGPSCEFPWRLADPLFFPAPGAAGAPDNAAYNLRPIGNGPFRLASYTPDKSVELTRNDSWAFGEARLDRVIVRLSLDSTRMMTSFGSGEVGWVSLTDVEARRAARGQSGRIEYPVATSRMLVPLTARGPMRSREARLAVSYALDRSAIAAQAFGRPARSLVPPPVAGFGRPGVCPSCDAPDPAQARRLAAQAGLGAGTTIDLHTMDTGTQLPLAEQIGARLQNVLGWRVRLRTVKGFAYDKLRDQVTAKDASGLMISGWSPDYPTGSTLLRSVLGGDQLATGDNALNNYSGWRNARFDGLLDQVRRTPGDAERTRLTQEAEKIALDDMAIIPVVSGGGVAFRSDRYIGLNPDFDGHPTLATAARR